MRSAFIIHRSYSNPDDDWYPWLTRELEALGYTVFRPKFPTPEHQSLAAWLEVFQPYAQHVNSESIFIGHGIGCAFILHILEQDIPKARALFLIAPFVEPLRHQALRMLEATFTTSPFAWKHIHEQYTTSSVIYAADDPYVSPELSQQVADLLSSTVYTLPTGGHFAGMETFPYLLNCISETLTKEIVSPEVQAKEDLEDELIAIGITLPEKTIRDEKEGAGVVQESEEAEDDVEEQKNFTKEHNLEDPVSTLPEINTYYQDITNTLTTSDTKTMANVLRTERMRIKDEETRKHLVIVHSLYIFLTVVVLVVGVYFLNRARSPQFVPEDVPDAITLPSEIPVDTQFVWNISNGSLFDLRATLNEWKEKPLELPGTVHQVVLAFGGAGATVRTLSLDQVFAAFERSLPSELNESTAGYMYGWYTADARYPFIILNITSFDKAFSGARAWEKSFVRDVSDMFFINRGDWFQDIELLPFEETLLNNYKLHAVYANRVNETRTPITIDTILTTVPKRHILTSDILGAIQSITPEEIIFARAHNEIRAFSLGDIIVGQPTSTTPGFVRKIVNFSLDEAGLLHVATLQASGTDILPDAAGKEIKQRVNTSGAVEYYTTHEEEQVSRDAGERKIVLFYTFISDTQLLIATDPQVLSEIIERSAKKVRMNAEASL